MADRLHRTETAQPAHAPFGDHLAHVVGQSLRAAFASSGVVALCRRERDGHVAVRRRTLQLLVADVCQEELVQFVLAESLDGQYYIRPPTLLYWPRRY